MTFPIGCSVSFCSKTLPLNTSLFEETVFEKSQVFNLGRFKISICIWWRFVRVRTFEITEWVFVRFFWNQLWLSFDVNTGIDIFRSMGRRTENVLKGLSCEKQLCWRGVFLLPQDEHIIVLCFYFSCWLWNVFFVDMEIFLMKSTFGWKKMNNCSSFKINTTTWVLHSKCKNARVLFIFTMICFAFFWWQEWQVLDGVAVLGHFQHRDWLFGNAS